MVAPGVKELLLLSLEHGRGGVLVVRSARACTEDERLCAEFDAYFEQTMNHVEVLTRVCEELGLDPDETTPGCEIVREADRALVQAISRARAEGDPVVAERVACYSVVLAETRDHANWELIGACGEELDGEVGDVLREAYEEIDDEDVVNEEEPEEEDEETGSQRSSVG